MRINMCIRERIRQEDVPIRMAIKQNITTFGRAISIILKISPRPLLNLIWS